MSELFLIVSLYLKYNSETGNLIWIKKPSQATYIGTVAGCRMLDGAIRIHLKGKNYLEEASEAYCVAAITHFGKFARMV